MSAQRRRDLLSLVGGLVVLFAFCTVLAVIP